MLEENYEISLLTDYDIYLFKEGKHYRLYEKLGSHYLQKEGGVYFAVWAPNAKEVHLIGDFNDWKKNYFLMKKRNDGSGIWEIFVEGLKPGSMYKYYIVGKEGYTADKSDPFAFYCEKPPGNASIIWSMKYQWKDEEWMKNRYKKNSLTSPFAIYEVHLGSWKRIVEENNRWMDYREAAVALGEYLDEMGFTHLELMPIMESPFYGSWGYQITNYFAPTSRYGKPEDFMYFVDNLHRKNKGVILDIVFSHFPTDEHGLAYFDGTHLFEYEDPRKRWHPDWNTYVFDYSKNEVRSFLISAAMFWLDKYHADGLRLDAVASMLYLDYSRKDWTPNICGGKENLEAIDFIRELNKAVYKEYPDVQMIAEESTAWPLVSRPPEHGGLGFGMKWNMGWMHDTLFYFSLDPIYRKFHHDILAFNVWYAFSENFVLPISHDEVTYGKRSLLNKMPGDEWQKFANLRLFLGYMYAFPGKKLLFMGCEFAQKDEWNHEKSLDWHLLKDEKHRKIKEFIKDLNKIYCEERALHETDFDPRGFEWIDYSDRDYSIISFLRKSYDDELILIVCNFTPVPRLDYRVGVPRNGFWKEILNSDSIYYGGSNIGNLGGKEAEEVKMHNRNYSLKLNLPPLAVLYLKNEKD